MDKSKAKSVLSDLQCSLKNEEMETWLACNSMKFLEHQECYKQARAELAGAKAAISALGIYTDEEMDEICKNMMKEERTRDGLFKSFSGKKKIAWKSFFFPVIECIPAFLYYWMGVLFGIVVYRLMH